jgi:simple sugar transport system permease protein
MLTRVLDSIIDRTPIWLRLPSSELVAFTAGSLLLIATLVAVAALAVPFAWSSDIRWADALSAEISTPVTLLLRALHYATPLVLAGAAVALAGRAGLINVGVEGQLCLGAFVTAVVAGNYPFMHWCPDPARTALSLMAAMAFGALLGWISGWGRARRNVHEVLTTLFLGFAVIYFINFLLQFSALRAPAGGAATVKIPESASILLRWPELLQGTRATGADLVLPSLVLLALWWFLFRTYPGLWLRGVGVNPEAHDRQRVGWSRVRLQTMALTLSGAIAGFVGWQHVLGDVRHYPDAFRPGFGWLGLGLAFASRQGLGWILWGGFCLGLAKAVAIGLSARFAWPSDTAALADAVVLAAIFLCRRWHDRHKPWSVD